MSVDYPATIPLTQIQEIVRIVRAKRWSEERAALALHVWNVQGYCQLQAFGAGKETIFGASFHECDDVEACAALESMAIDEGKTMAANSAVSLTLLRWLVKLLVDRLL